jgi:hypothetical protein
MEYKDLILSRIITKLHYFYFKIAIFLALFSIELINSETLFRTWWRKITNL